MNLFNRMKHYNFWVALTMAVLLLLNTLARAFDFNIDEAVINDIIMAVLGVLVVLGLIQKDDYDFVDTSKKDEDKQSLNFDTKKENTSEEFSETPILPIEKSEENEVDLDKIIKELKNDINDKK